MALRRRACLARCLGCLEENELHVGHAHHDYSTWAYSADFTRCTTPIIINRWVGWSNSEESSIYRGPNTCLDQFNNIGAHYLHGLDPYWTRLCQRIRTSVLPCLHFTMSLPTNSKKMKARSKLSVESKRRKMKKRALAVYGSSDDASCRSEDECFGLR